MDDKLLRYHNSPSPNKDSNSHLNDVTFGPAIQGGPLPINCLLANFNLYAAQNKLSSEFALESQEGTPHNPLFKFTLKVNGDVYYGSGSTKKLAKNQAARSFFDHIRDQKNKSEKKANDIVLSDETPRVQEEKMSTIYVETPVNINYIGNLHEICAKHSLPIPEYDFKEEMLSSTMYIARCRVGDKSSEGQNSSKKEAKKIASKKMIEILESNLRSESQGIPSTSSVSNPSAVHQKEVTSIIPDEKKTLMPLDSACKKKIAVFQKILTKSDDLQNFLMETDIFEMSIMNYAKFLTDISTVHGFQVTYDFQVIEKEGLSSLCIAQLGVFPVIVAVGMGSNVDEAKNIASRNALIYLKVLLK